MRKVGKILQKPSGEYHLVYRKEEHEGSHSIISDNVYERFKTEAEARKFAEDHNIELEEE